VLTTLFERPKIGPAPLGPSTTFMVKITATVLAGLHQQQRLPLPAILVLERRASAPDGVHFVSGKKDYDVENLIKDFSGLILNLILRD
jgi:hypothetical protein